MDYLLVLASFSNEGQTRRPVDDAYPLGLGYLHAAAERLGFAGGVVDLSMHSEQECVSKVLAAIAREMPKVVGFEVLSRNRGVALRLVDTIRSLWPAVQIVVGGPHVTATAKRMVALRPFLLAMVGEAEAAFCDLLSRVRRGLPAARIPGLVWSTSGGAVEAERAAAPSMAELPWASHRLFLSSRSTTASVMTSRGCPFNCSFCAVARQASRLRSVEDVVDEVQHIKESFPAVHTIRFWDDQMFYRNDRVIALCNEVVRRNLRLNFTALARFKPCSPELVCALEEAGFLEVTFGLETGSPDIGRRCAKGLLLDDAVSTLELFSGSVIRCYSYLIAGLPGETWETIEETLRFVRRLNSVKYMPLGDFIGVATVYPGTGLEQIAREAGIVDDSYWDEGEEVPMFTVEHPAPTLHAMQQYLLDGLDPRQLFRSKRAFQMQTDSLFQLIQYTYENWSTPRGPHCTDEDLLPVAGLAIEGIAEMERRGAYSFRAVGSASRLRAEAGVSATRLIRRGGSPARYCLEERLVTGAELALLVANSIGSGKDRRLKEVFRECVGERLRARLGQQEACRADDIADVPCDGAVDA